MKFGWLALGCAVATTAWSAGEKPKLLVLELQAAGGIEPALAHSLSEALGATASQSGLFSVATSSDAMTLLGVERQKQLLGCSEDGSSCLAELAGAMGSRFVLSGTLAKLGDEAFQLTLQTQDVALARAVGRSARITKDLVSLRAELPWALAEATATPAPPSPSRALPIALVTSGSAVALAGGVLLLQSLLRENELAAELRLSREQPEVQLRTASYYQGQLDSVVALRVGGFVAAGVGVAALVAGLVVWPRGESGRVALVPTLNGAFVVGVW
ncbi:MAG: hypothetical protein Q8L48_30475 [Archangium sp.]|nr:hypothetical protein [Archangium sp.]